MHLGPIGVIESVGDYAVTFVGLVELNNNSFLGCILFVLLVNKRVSNPLGVEHDPCWFAADAF